MMKPCRECGHDVSNQAKTCPHCGVRNPAAGALQAVGDVAFRVGCLLMLVPVLVILLLFILAAVA